MNNLNFLVDVLKESPVFKTLEKNVKPGRTVCASGLSTINKSNIIYALCRLKGVTAFCLASDEKEAQTLCNDLSCMGLRAHVYPVRDFNFLDFQSRSHEYEHARLKVLLKLINHECDVAIACVDAAAQLTVPRNVLEQSVIEFEEGRELSLEKATKALTLLGYERFDAVEGSGQFSLRGGILDFFMPDSDYPVRCEFWGDEITDLSYFDIETQRRFKKADKITLSPSTEIVIEDRAALADKIEHKAKLLRSKNSAKAKEKLFSEAELIRSGAMIANADKFINQIYDKPESLFDYLARLKVLLKLINHECDVAIACVDAAAQLTVPRNVLEQSVIEFEEGRELSLEKATKALTLLGYERFDAVEGSGQFSLRGGILDFFMPDSDYPVRCEFWGDEITDLSYFDIETQRRFKKADKITLSPSTEIVIEDRAALADKIEHKAKLLRSKNSAKAKEKLFSEAELIRSGAMIANADKFINQIYDKPESLFDYLDRNTLVFASEFTAIQERGKSMDFISNETLMQGFEDGTLCRGFDRFALTFNECTEFLQSHGTIVLENFVHGSMPIKLSEIISFSTKQLSAWGGSYKQLKEDVDGLFTPESKGVIFAGTERAAKNLCDTFNADGINAVYSEGADKISKGELLVMQGALSAGFEYPSQKFFAITYSQVSYRPEKSKKKKKKTGQEIYSLSELAPGDYVVHNVHGIGVFGGIRKIDTHGVIKDYIKIDYAKGDVLYVPVTQLDMVAKYIGPKEDSRVKLNRLGSGDWQKAKARVKTSVKDIAKELIELYSQRMKAKGYAFSADNEWQRDFELSFEYDETPDQLRCCEEIKHDMMRSSPMDRLLCGDVGFGKTEVALRAAFKCIADSKQCALLCPTTILAWQHYQTVIKRFEGYPVRVELLSRFRTAKQQKEILQKLKRGEIDMIVGTHRLVQKDVEFRDLGLAIIDEEQRFGVAQKERFKELCKNVDVLTLSATPIPRTLNMAMSGLRDMSVIEEAPTNRQPVQTYVLEHDDAVINEAIRRELRRGGQVFYLHNNVETISSCAAKIQEAVPEAKIAIGHGKMKEGELSEVWRQMLEQEIDVLVCTTIIETGVDLPNANTLIIENADCMGLSQLHQLRGRVGRSSRRAYAYFTFRRNKVLTEIQQKRLAAIREFTEFGSGFRIAMRDLELRGAGNIMGAQQHGHMESVGYDMYLKLLDEAVSEEKGEQNVTKDLDCLIDISVDAHIPESYVESLTLRLDVYRRIADIRSNEDADDVIDELQDRFGKIPNSVLGLIDIALVRNKAYSMGIYEIRQNGTTLMLFVNELKSPQVADLLIALGGKAKLVAGAKPCVAVECKNSSAPLEILTKIFGVQ